jgi:hypothetical protein
MSLTTADPGVAPRSFNRYLINVAFRATAGEEYFAVGGGETLEEAISARGSDSSPTGVGGGALESHLRRLDGDGTARDRVRHHIAIADRCYRRKRPPDAIPNRADVLRVHHRNRRASDDHKEKDENHHVAKARRTKQRPSRD